MTKRLYLTNASPEYTPATLKGAWDDTTQTVARALADAKSGASTTVAQADGTATTSDLDFYMGRWILHDELVLTPGSLAGSATLMLAKQESNASANHRLHAHMWVTQGDSDSVRGTLVSDFIYGTETPTTMTGVSHALTLSPVDVQQGDRIVLELGYRVFGAASSTSYTGTYRYGGTDSTDLAAGTTGVTTRSPWIEFSDSNGVIGPPPKRFTDLVDAITGTTRDTTKWPTVFGSFAQNNRFEGTDNIATVQSAHDYMWSGSSILAQMSPPVGVGVAMTIAVDATSDFMQVVVDAANDICMWRYAPGGVTSWQDFVAGGYDAVNHAWIRLRDDGTNSYLDTSPDGLTWTNQFSRVTPALLNGNTNNYLQFTQNADAGGSFSGTWWVDNVNNPPPPLDQGAGMFARFR